jgi:hypothetical protein
MNNKISVVSVLLAITAGFCFALMGASLAMIGLNHVSAKLGFAIAVFSLLTGWLSVNSIVDIVFEEN